MVSLIQLVIPLVIVAGGAFALFWVIRLGVRYGLRDHAQWVKAGGAPVK